jgi:hypothetical protein
MRHILLEECLEYVFKLYGPLAQQLHMLHEDPLHPKFWETIAAIRKGKEKIAEVLDHVYPNVHPTIKTVYDAYLVRRYYHLEDWIKHVEAKRNAIFENFSPEFVAEAEKLKGIAEVHIERLKKLEVAFHADPVLGLLDESKSYSPEEIQMFRQKVQYHRNMMRVGYNNTFADTHM